MINKEFSFQSNGTRFFGQYWQAEKTNAVLVLLHGMGSHSGRWSSMAKKLTENNFSVVSYDNFGHGKTLGKRGHNPSYEALLDVVDDVIREAKELFLNKPVFLYGHSMGGNIVVNYVLRRKHSLNGVVASSPFLKLAFQPPVWKIHLGKLMQKIAPSITLGNELNPADVTRDQNEVDKYKDDDFVHHKISPNYSLKLFETGEWAIKNAHQLNIPMIMLHGTGDKIIDYKGSVAFSKKTTTCSIKSN